MSDESSSSIDVLGLKPISDSVLKLTTAVVDGSVGFLDKICSPAAKEYGLLLKDKVKAWRADNAARIVAKAQEKVGAKYGEQEVKADPRTVFSILEHGSWIDDSVVQDLWAGLLSSSCTEDGEDDSNLLFTNILGQMTKLQARIFQYACKASAKYRSNELFISSETLKPRLSELAKIVNETDPDRIDREVAGLATNGLFNGGVERLGPLPLDGDPDVVLTPLTLALNMYVRCMGSRLTVSQFFDPPK